jgi:hypothetical protein
VWCRARGWGRVGLGVAATVAVCKAVAREVCSGAAHQGLRALFFMCAVLRWGGCLSAFGSWRWWWTTCPPGCSLRAGALRPLCGGAPRREVRVEEVAR